MKKVALSLLAFALVGGAAFADATADVVKNPLSISLDVSASASWGYDLDTKNHGFSVNSGSKALTLWFANGSSAKTGDGDVHGYINVADIKFGFDDSLSLNNATDVGAASKADLTKTVATTPAFAVGDVTAKIVAGDLYVKISTNTNPSVGYGIDVDDDNGGAATSNDDTFKTSAGVYGAQTEWGKSGVKFILSQIGSYSEFDGQGIEVGYSIPKVASFTVGIASQNDWTSGKQGDYEESIAIGLLAVEKLTLEGKFYHATDLNAAGATGSYDLGVLVPGFNVNYNVANSKYVADGFVKLPLADGFKAVALAQYTSDSIVNVQGTVSLATGKLVGPLSLDLGAKALDATKQTAAGASLEVFGKVGLKATDTLALSATVDAQNADTIYAKASAEYTGISLTTLGVYWDSSDIGAANRDGTSKLGKVVVTAKVAY